MNIQNAIDIKKRKLAWECSKINPNKIVIKRLKESIRRHEHEMKRYNRYKKKHLKRRIQEGRW